MAQDQVQIRVTITEHLSATDGMPVVVEWEKLWSRGGVDKHVEVSEHTREGSHTRV